MGSIASPERPASQDQARKRYSLNRVLHRVVGLLAALLMLWLAVTGSIIQIIDLKAILTHESPVSPTELSMAEGTFGPANFVVLQVSDFAAAAFPKDFDLNKGLATVLQAAHTPQNAPQTRGVGSGGTGGPDSSARAGGSGVSAGRAPSAGPGSAAGQGAGGGRGGQPAPMAWVEMRVVNGVPIGQVMMGTQLLAFNAQTGASVTAFPPVLLPQGRGLPYSLRQKLKTLHRFWNRGDTPGVYFEFLAGLLLWLLLITGLVMYFRLLGTRVKQGRPQPFWLTGGSWWRGWHRVISVLAAIFILSQAFTGTWLGFESSASALRRSGGGPPPAAAGQQGQPGGAQGPGRRNPLDFVIPLRDAEVEDMNSVTLASMQKLHPDLPIKAIRLRIYGQMKQGVVITGGDETSQYVFNADSGQPASLSEGAYPESGFPFGVQVHENIKHFHSGATFGIPTRLMNLFSGFSLTFLAGSGLVLYFDMWLKRRKGGRMGLFWK